jgi:oxygen-dependent protoporphyrinogen oxidase
MFSFRDGMQTLTDALGAGIRSTRSGATVTRIARSEGAGFDVTFHDTDGERTVHARTVLVAAHAAGAAELVREIAPPLPAVFGAMIYPPVAVVVSAYPRADVRHALDGFGFLIPAKEQRRVLGTIFTSTIFSDRVRDGHVLLTSFVGGMRQPDLARLSEEEIAELAQSEQTALLGAAPRAAFVRVTKWERAIPQYTHGHLERIAAVEQTERDIPGLFFCANYRGGISVGDCVKSADRTVGAIEEFLRSAV